MPAPLTIPIVRDDRWAPGTRLEIRVDGALQNDRPYPWGPLGTDTGTPADPRGQRFGEGVFGFSDAALVLGDGLFGAGVFGVAAALIEHETIAAFDEGDYDVTVTPVDVVGNAAPGSPEAAVIAHRPLPGAPQDFAIDDVDPELLTWTWP